MVLFVLLEGLRQIPATLVDLTLIDLSAMVLRASLSMAPPSPFTAVSGASGTPTRGPFGPEEEADPASSHGLSALLAAISGPPTVSLPHPVSATPTTISTATAPKRSRVVFIRFLPESRGLVSEPALRPVSQTHGHRAFIW
ncbi:hypothetical protein ACLMAL_08605 [Nocardia sp. CWNU-33]|uniref:hypothetical protein n=1 Tax=Nocardia sp. CWNU-33 TaxID=3392117 RepID=UPI00398F6A49